MNDENMTESQVVEKLEAQRAVVARLRKLGRVKNEFVQMVAHGLRTPMTSLMATVEMLLAGDLGSVTPEQKESLQRARANIQRLICFTTDILSLSRLESGQYPLRPGDMVLLPVIETVLEFLGDKARERNVVLGVDVVADIRAFADTDALYIVLTNLLDNAIVHSPEGTMVFISSRQIDENFVEVTVADNGQGIPRDALDKVFDPFYTAHARPGVARIGTGLGLSICKILVEAMGGDLSVESFSESSTVFRFTLPAREIPGL